MPKKEKAVDSIDQVLSEFIAADQVWYLGRSDHRPALLSDLGLDDGQDGVCLFHSQRQALDFLRKSNVPPGSFRPRRGAPHPRRPLGVGSFVRACRKYSPFLCLPWPTARSRRFDFYFLEIKHLMAAARQGQAR
jgi:hypothetical protein